MSASTPSRPKAPNNAEAVAPTAATTSSINSLVRQGAYNMNGQRSMFNNFLLDGRDNQFRTELYNALNHTNLCLRPVGWVARLAACPAVVAASPAPLNRALSNSV
jgi:hypothetical protein